MANQEHLDILKQGVETWNQWRKDRPEIQPDLSEAYLIGADLRKAHLEGTNLHNACLGAKIDSSNPMPSANLQGAFFDKLTNLEGVILGNGKAGFVSLVDVDWNGVNLALIEWKHVQMLGEEFEARKLDDLNGIEKKVVMQIKEYQTAIRANRQLAIALQNEGLNEQASYFAYRAQVNQRYLFKLQVLQELEQISVLRFLLYKPNKKLNRFKLLFIALSIPPLINALVSIVLILKGWVNFTIDNGSTNLIHRNSYADLFVSLIISVTIILLYLLIFKVSFRIFLIFLFAFSFYLVFIFSIITWIINIFIGSDVLFYLIAIIPTLSIGVFIIIIQNLAESLIKEFVSSNFERKNSNIKTQLVNWTNSFFRKIYLIAQPLMAVQEKYGQYIFSLFLDLLAGNGYKPGRSVRAYLLVIIAFASLYYGFGHLLQPQLSLSGAIVLSLTSFHGRGFFPGLSNNGNGSLDNPLIVLAACEAVIGLIIEISFIATFTQRYFGK